MRRVALEDHTCRSDTTARAGAQVLLRRLVALAALLAASVAVQPSASSAESGPVLPFRIADSFDGQSLDQTVWFTDQQSEGTTQDVQGRSLLLTASKAAASGFHDGILTRCQAQGDFDAQIDFTLLTWLGGDNVSLAVNAPNVGNTFVENAVGGDVDGLFVQPSAFVTIPAFVRIGDLRLARRGDQTSAYLRFGPVGQWQQIAQFSGSTSDTWVGVAIWNISGFGGRPVAVRVNSFELDAAGLSC